MVEDEETSKAFVEWLSSMNEQSPVVIAFKKFRAVDKWYTPLDTINEYKEKFHQVLLKDLKRIGFKDDVISELMDYLYKKFIQINGVSSEDVKSEIKSKVMKTYLNGKKRAEKTITAKEYWESYFKKHPEQRPKRIVYYDGDPSEAVRKFLLRNDIYRVSESKKESKLLGFDDHLVLVENMREDLRANRGNVELVEIALKIIEEYYNKDNKEKYKKDPYDLDALSHLKLYIDEWKARN